MRIINPRIEKAAGGEFIAYMSDNTKYRIETNGVWYRLTPRATRTDRLAKKKEKRIAKRLGLSLEDIEFTKAAFTKELLNDKP